MSKNKRFNGNSRPQWKSTNLDIGFEHEKFLHNSCEMVMRKLMAICGLYVTCMKILKSIFLEDNGICITILNKAKFYIRNISIQKQSRESGM